jgi:NTE family protein
VSTAPISLELGRLFAAAWPAEPLWVCAVELDTGKRVVLGTTSGPATDVGTAVAASSAAPSLFQPVIVQGARLVDGGLHSPANADVAVDFPGELDALVVSTPMGIGGRPGRLGVDLPGRLMNHLLTARELTPVRGAGVAVEVFEPGASELELMHYNAFELEGRAEIAARAYRAARDRLETVAQSKLPLAAVADLSAS